MRDSLRLGRVSGIPIGVHWSLLGFGLFAIVNLAFSLYPVFAPGSGTIAYLTAATLGVIGLFASILLHELGHSLVAQREDISVDGITLWLLGGVARLDREPDSPGAAFRVAAAGPAVSVVLAVMAGLATYGVYALGFGDLLFVTVGYLALANASLALFNLLPALPLDGGRILQSWLWHRNGNRHRATISAARLGRLLGGIAIVVGLFELFSGSSTGIWTMMLGWFVRRSATAERRHARRRLRAEQRPPRPRPVWLWPPHVPIPPPGSAPFPPPPGAAPFRPGAVVLEVDSWPTGN